MQMIYYKIRMGLETINEYLKLKEELDKYGISTQDIDKLLNLLVNAKEYGFDGKKIVGKLRKIKRLKNKEEKLKHHCEILSEQVKECNNVLPLAQKIRAMNIDIKELMVFDTTHSVSLASIFGYDAISDAYENFCNRRFYTMSFFDIR
jgi:hypothetical protein